MILRTLSPAITPASLVACRWLSLKEAGTVTTASVTGVPRYASAVSFILTSTMELISSGVKVFSSLWCSTLSLGRPFCSTTWKGQCFLSDCTVDSLNFLPINLFASKMVLLGFMATWFLAASPISLSVSVVLLPWSLAMISTLPCWNVPTQEYVVPRSIPTATLLPILCHLFAFPCLLCLLVNLYGFDLPH